MERIYGYIVWFTVTLFVVYAFCLNTAAAVFADTVKTTLGTNSFYISLAMSAFIFSFACMQIPAGYLLDKFNPKIIVSTGILLFALGNVLTSFANNLVLFTLSNIVQGSGASFAFVSAAVLISQWFSELKFPILFGFTQTMSCVLSGIIHYYFTIELGTYTWNNIYRSLSFFGFALFLLSLLTVRSPPGYKSETNLSLKKSLSIVLRNKQIILCSAAAAMSFGVLLAYASLWYIKIQSYYLIANIKAVIISGMTFVGIGVGTPFLGWLSNKVQSRVMVIHVTLCLGTMVLILGIYLPHFNSQGLLLVLIISFLIGFFLSGSMLFYSMISELSTNATRGVAISVLNTAVFLFNTLMMFLPYFFLTSYSKEFFTYLWTLPFFILIAILLLYFIKESSSFTCKRD